MSLLDGFDDDQQELIDEPQTLDSLMPVTNSADEEAPMFYLAKVDYKPNGLKYMVVSNDVLVMAQLNVHIIRLNLQCPEDLEDIEISRRLDDQIHKIFLDTLGHHLIISMESKENYYIHSSWKKPKALPKLRGLLIDSVAWLNSPHPNAPTVNVLLGTSDGRIFETIIETTEKKLVDLVGGKEQYLKLLYVLGDKSPITGLRTEKFPPHPDPNKYFIMVSKTTNLPHTHHTLPAHFTILSNANPPSKVTTASRNYQFVGGPTMEDLFQGYDNNPGFQEMPGTPRSELVFYSKPNSLPRSFAWSTEPGIYHGDMVFRNQPGDKVVVDTELLPYPKKDNKGVPIAPLSMTMSEFHFLLLYEDQLQVICKLNAAIVFENDFNPRQMRLRGIAHDFVKGTVWIYGEQAVYEVVITNEDRDVWKLFLEKNQFSTALQYCKEPNARDKKDKVWTVQAENFFAQGKYDEAATYFAKTARVFEEVTLKFININERDALKTYLLHKLDNIKPREATQRTIICTWLTEIYVNKLNLLKNKKPPASLQQQQQIALQQQQQQQYTNLQKEFRLFLTDHKEHLNQTTTFNIISSHGCIEELIFYATLIEDYERVISHHIQHSDYSQALAVLDRLAASGSVHEEVFYKFSPVLFHYAPQETVNVWIKASFLTPSKLIPSLMRYDPQYNNPKGPHQAIRYLQHCVGNLNNTDPTIHNYLLSLYAKQSDPGPLLAFLGAEKYFDLKYALRLCTKEQQLQACVLIYSAMGLYEEAVDLALKVDIKLAKENADKPEDDEALRKKLWLRIAKHVVEERKDIKEAMAFLQQCDLLKIEDILPFFPDFVLIADFKEQICKSLEEYNRHIEDLKEEMNDATRSADLIRLDIKDLRNKYGFVAASQKCCLCGYPVLTKQFYLFPCQHVFHSECLVQEMMKHLNAVQRVRVKELQLKLAVEPTVASPTPKATDDIAAVSTTDILKNELDEYVASECVFCGDVMIKSIDKPFVSSTEPDLRSWVI